MNTGLIPLAFITALAASLYRYFMHKRKNQIYEWYQIYRRPWMKDCAACLFYNLAFIEAGLWAMFVYDIILIFD